MSIANTETGRQGGRFNADLGMLLTFGDITKIGEMSLQSLVHFLMILFYDDREGVPVSGFPRSLAGNLTNSGATMSGDLTFDVAGGWGLVFDAALLGADEFGSEAYQMVASASGFSDTLAAHDPADPRIDLIALKPLRIGDQAATRNIKNPTTGALSTSSVDLRDRLGADLVIVTGTPAASPVAPVLPAGHLAVAFADVPAAAGAAVLRDARQIIHVGNLIKGGPSSSYSLDHVHPLGLANELDVSEHSPTGLVVVVTRGRANISGHIRHYPTQDLTITAADPTDPRIDTVSVVRDGTVVVTTGTPDPTPVAPVGPANSIPIAEVAVAALAVVILNADITDVRVRTWLEGSFAIRKETLPHQALTVKPYILALTATSTPSGDIKRLEYQVQYPDGSPWDGSLTNVRALVETLNLDGLLGVGGTFFPTTGPGGFKGVPHLDKGQHGGAPIDFALFPHLGCVNQGIKAHPSSPDPTGLGGSTTGRMFIDVQAVDFSIEWVRNAGTTPAGKVYVSMQPIGGGGLPTPPDAFPSVEF